MRTLEIEFPTNTNNTNTYHVMSYQIKSFYFPPTSILFKPRNSLQNHTHPFLSIIQLETAARAHVYDTAPTPCPYLPLYLPTSLPDGMIVSLIWDRFPKEGVMTSIQVVNVMGGVIQVSYL
jgi:hypothetical protein